MIKRTLIYGFPFFLILIEILLRKASDLEAQTFMGPTLASVGIGFLLPLVVPKDRSLSLPEHIREEARQKKLTIISNRERHFIDLVWIFIFVLTGLWVGALYLSTQAPHQGFLIMPYYLWLGFASYLIGVIFSEFKEVV